jgi:2-keto-4-pentenoate hydratase/2-oxohepta-3-ene-1,7-dioic acid hydratase in catechol pathway
MKLVLYENPAGAPVRPGVLQEDGVVDVSEATARLHYHAPQQLMVQIINRFDDVQPHLQRLAASGQPLPLAAVRLRAPLPRPGKILCCIGNYREPRQRQTRPLNMFLKNSDAVIGPGDTVVLPDMEEPWVFHHEAELAMVIQGPARRVSQHKAERFIFGYTGLIDVSARAEGRHTWRSGSWLGKSFDTFAPLGPCIVTADEIPDPHNLRVRFWDNGQLRHDYNTSDMQHGVPELIEFASRIMTLYSGDVIACGTNHEGLGPLQDGDVAEIDIERIGRMTVHVSDPLKRTWERGVYGGPDATARAARS